MRTPAVAGTFYPSDPLELRREVGDYLRQVELPVLRGLVVAALAPHAGYRYSAAVAAYTHQAMRNVPVDTLVVIGHDSHARGIVAVLPRAEMFSTPLGDVEVDTELASRLSRHDKRIVYHEPAHDRDHTIEVHLPFLQVLGRHCRVLPLLFGEPTVQHAMALTEALRTCRGERRLFVLASTDLCHYPPAELAQELDAETLATLAELNLPAFAAHLERHRSGEDGVQTAMCGAGGAMTAALCALDDGDAELQILKQTNSGDSGGDLTRVVGYAAAVFVRRRSTLNQAEFSLPEDICHELLSLARRRLATAMDGERLEYEPSSAQREILSQPGAVFVTLRKDGQLRGCMGTTQARDSLWHAVYDLAYSAGFHDPRFPSLTAGELADVTIEISVLSPLVPIRSHAEITPNVHGVVVRQGDRSGVFLPQVWEQLPNKEDFLTFLCLEKARIPADAWRDGTAQLERFTVFSFEEEDRP